jgi:tetratricopeptide (TPR) repeat protein
MNRKFGLLSIICLLVLSSCVSYKEFSIEVFKPSELNLRAGAKKIVLVSRNLKYRTDTLQHYYQRNNSLVKDKVKSNFDSLAIAASLDTLSNRLINRGNFAEVERLPVSTFSTFRVGEIRPAKAEWYKALAEKNGADYLVLLDMFSCFYSMSSAEYSPESKIVTSNIWSVYSANNQRIIDRFSQIDTLYWNKLDEHGNSTKTIIPDKKNAIVLAAGVIGQNYSKRILPSWTKVERTYMLSNDPTLQQAVKMAQNNQWEQAIAIWNDYSECKNKSKKASALFNLAVASEMNGDVDKAIEFTDKAAKVSSGLFLGSVNEQVRKYSIVLYQRKNEIAKLKQYYEDN